MTSDEKSDSPCPTCGGSRFTWGMLGAQGLNFTPQDASVIRKFFTIGWELPARRCDDCGNLQLFAKPHGGQG
jgi:hypothetical protein